MKLNIGVIFGGVSLEHDLSIVTAVQAMTNINKDNYEVVPIYITKTGEMYTGGCLKFIDTYKDFELIKRYAKKITIVSKDRRYILQTVGLIKREVNEIHLAFPIGHGANMEDGSIMGYLNILGIPYVGNSIYSSAVSQDKAFMKQILSSCNIPTTNFVWFGERFYRNKKHELFKQIDELKYPLIIKPTSLGSSIGIEAITRKEELDSSIEKCFKYDTKLIIEEKIEDLVEYNIAVLLTENGNITSEIEEITTNKEIIEYGDKVSSSLKTDSSVKRKLPADISVKLREEIEITALSVFKLLNMRGCARIDFLYDKTNKKLYVDEVNSMPWCFSHHLWERKNISYQELLNIMIKDAINNEKIKSEMVSEVESDIISKLTANKLKEMK